MYELKKIGKIFTSKSVETGPLVLWKNNIPGRGLTKFEKHWLSQTCVLNASLDLRHWNVTLCNTCVLQTDVFCYSQTVFEYPVAQLF